MVSDNGQQREQHQPGAPVQEPQQKAVAHATLRILGPVARSGGVPSVCTSRALTPWASSHRRHRRRGPVRRSWRRWRPGMLAPAAVTVRNPRGPVGWCAGRARGAPRRWCLASGGPWSSTSPVLQGHLHELAVGVPVAFGHEHLPTGGPAPSTRRSPPMLIRTGQSSRSTSVPATRSAAQALAVAPRSSSQPSGTRMASS